MSETPKRARRVKVNKDVAAITNQLRQALELDKAISNAVLARSEFLSNALGIKTGQTLTLHTGRVDDVYETSLEDDDGDECSIDINWLIIYRNAGEDGVRIETGGMFHYEYDDDEPSDDQLPAVDTLDAKLTAYSTHAYDKDLDTVMEVLDHALSNNWSQSIT